MGSPYPKPACEGAGREHDEEAGAGLPGAAGTRVLSGGGARDSQNPPGLGDIGLVGPERLVSAGIGGKQGRQRSLAGER